MVSPLAAIAIERKTIEDRLAYQAQHDPLTGLPNRVLFVEFLTLALARAPRRKTTSAVLFLDLDRFKVVNDSLGHDAGDELMVKLGTRLSSGGAARGHGGTLRWRRVHRPLRRPVAGGRTAPGDRRRASGCSR